MTGSKSRPSNPPPLIRCAIYTRKSTEEGLEQEFNSLMAQREAAEAYILSQREEGWTAVAERFDDGGFSGGNIERPALKRLLAAVEKKQIECVIVYKVDRLSRSLLDFAGIIGLLDQHGVSFVSVTQQFNTNTSLGRLTLNVLLSFAQFEREIISERTRDKVFAARRKGKWTGGLPMLGYDVDIRGGKLNVNEAEAEQVRGIFETFARKRTLTATLYEMDRRGWKSKSWVTRGGNQRRGNPFTRHTLKSLLSNPLYVGKVRLKGELHEGEHPAIIKATLWREVTARLESNRREPEAQIPKPLKAMLRGLLFCAACGAPMVPAYTKRKTCQVRYYACLSAQKRGWKTCPGGRVSARGIEEAVLQKVNEARPQAEDNGTTASIKRLVEKVTYHGGTGRVVISLREATVIEAGKGIE
jgi:site-specific DNA recombinase